MTRERLNAYRGKRDFGRTREPRGDDARPPTPEPRFVIQHHHASADHYDFRLEIDGVLVSWAVPKGPSLDPRERRLAKRTEDHPLDYEDFEGVIAKGEYGGGTVQVWDRGTFRAVNKEGLSAAEALGRGRLSFVLTGEKIRGGFSLIRTRGADKWLLIKKKDEYADARRRPTSSMPRSVLTGRTMREIAAAG